MNEQPNRNVALLIDADNASHNDLDPVLTVLAELGNVNVRRVYGNWTKPALKGWKEMTVKHGIEPQQQFDITKGKNATDMKMTIDAMDLLFRGRVDGFGIMSSDSDFMPLAMRIRQDGIPVYGFGGAKTPEAFKQACTRFIDVGALRKEAPARPVVATDVPIEQSLPPALGSASGKKTGVDPELLKLLIDTYEFGEARRKGLRQPFRNGSACGQSLKLRCAQLRLSSALGPDRGGSQFPDRTPRERTDFRQTPALIFASLLA